MKKKAKRGWFGKFLFGAALGLECTSTLLHSQEPYRPRPVPVHIYNVPQAGTRDVMLAGTKDELVPPPPTFEGPIGDALAPAWADPVSRVPNFFGGFAASGVRACRNNLTTQTERFTGVGAEGNFFSTIFAPVTVNGAQGPFSLTQNITVPNPFANFPNFTLPENGELTPLIRAKFAGASFVSGGGVFDTSNLVDASFFYNYLVTSGQNVCVNLPNPSGGGLVGRNKYFDNGSPMPHDRVYFFYNHVGGYRGLGGAFDVNRYVFGVEKTFLDSLFSVELRVPFAGTANSDQVVGLGLGTDQTEFGNLGLAFKVAAYRTPNFLFSLGLGLSMPTADDSRMISGGVPVVVIENQTCLIQPLVGMIWAPNDRFYTQAGLQLDFDPSGNDVQALNAAGSLSRIGVLNDRNYSYLSGAAGYWIYQSDVGRLSGVALQGEVHYDSALVGRDSVQDGAVTVTDLSQTNFLFGSAGAIFLFGERAYLSLGVSFPLEGDRLYDWSLIAQLNYRFGVGR